jgi:small-conductance mechanosensitive channel
MQEVIGIGQEAIEVGRTQVVPWAVGLAIAVGVYLVLAFARRLLLRRVERSEAQVGWLNGLREALVRTSSLFLLVLAIYAGTFFVTLPPAVDRAIGSALVIALFLQGALWASHVVVGWIAWYAASKARQNRAIANALQLIQLFARVAVWSIALLLILNNLGFDITALVAGLGIGGIAVALAAQNILGDLFASLAIVLDQPFVVGDFVVLGDKMGTVERIGIKTTRIRSLSGEELIVSNADLLASRIHNFRRMAERRVVFTIGVTYETPAEKVEKLPDMLRTIVEAQGQVRFDRAHFARYGDFALLYEVVYWMLSADYNVYMDTQQRINLAIFRSLQDEGIAFAYPTQTIYLAPPVPATPAAG